MAGSGEYQVTARKWRPAEFDSVVGQEHVTQTLRNAIRNHRIHHAYLFSGPRGVGKTTTARILAKALNCQDPGENGDPCGTCESCVAITEGRSMDVVEIDGASNNSVDDIRVLRDNAKYPPLTGSYKLYIIDEVHMLSTSAFNALLKTLEEPPKHLVFVFATTEPHKVLPTILSRCQRFDFRRMQIESIVSRLGYIAEQEGMHPEEDGLVVIARRADGSMRDAQSIFDQVTAFCGSDFTYAEVNDALNLIDQEFYFRVTTMQRERAAAEAFEIAQHIVRTGYDINEFLIGLAEHYRHILSVLTLGSARLIETTNAIRERFEKESVGFEQGDIIRALHLTLAAQKEIRHASQPRLRLELLLIQLAAMDSTIQLEHLLAAIEGMPDGVVMTMTPRDQSPETSDDNSKGNETDQESDSSTATGQGSRDDEGGEEEDRGSGSSPADPPPPSDPLLNLRSFPTRAPGPKLQTPPSSESSNGNGSNGNSDLTNRENGSTDAIISIGELRSQWGRFREHYSSRMSLMYALENAAPGEVHGNILKLCVENEHQQDMIEQYRDEIHASIETFFRKPLIVESVIGRPAEYVAPRPTEQEPRRTDIQEIDHPFVKGIMELLGAVQI